MILCPFGCGERLYPDGKHANAEAAEIDKHKRECSKTRHAVVHATPGRLERPAMFFERDAAAVVWRMFAASALNGLHAAGDDDRGLNYAKRAAEEADALLTEYQARLSDGPIHARTDPERKPPR